MRSVGLGISEAPVQNPGTMASTTIDSPSQRCRRAPSQLSQKRFFALSAWFGRVCNGSGFQARNAPGGPL
jgi:hypothetical protein